MPYSMPVFMQVGQSPGVCPLGFRPSFQEIIMQETLSRTPFSALALPKSNEVPDYSRYLISVIHSSAFGDLLALLYCWRYVLFL